MNPNQDPTKVVYEEEFVGPTKELRVLGLAAYIPGGFILPYLLGLSEKPFVLFHVKQWFVMFSVALLLSAFTPIPIWFVFFAYLLLGAWHAYKAYQGESYQMGLVSSLIKWYGKPPSDPNPVAIPPPPTNPNETPK